MRGGRDNFMTYKCNTCNYEGHHYDDALIHASAHWPKAAIITAAPTRPVEIGHLTVPPTICPECDAGDPTNVIQTCDCAVL